MSTTRFALAGDTDSEPTAERGDQPCGSGQQEICHRVELNGGCLHLYLQIGTRKAAQSNGLQQIPCYS